MSTDDPRSAPSDPRGSFCVHYTDTSNRRILLRAGAYETFVLELSMPTLQRPARVSMSHHAAWRFVQLLETAGTAGRLPTSGDVPPVRVVHGHDGMKRRFDYVKVSTQRRGSMSSDLRSYRVILPLDVAREMASRLALALQR